MDTTCELAVLSDIHGNRWALEAVLEDIRKRNIHFMVNLGDCLYGPLDPGGTADILIQLNIPTVCGNEDRILLEGQSGKSSLSLQFTRNQLKPEHMRWLATLPDTNTFEHYYLCHGTPRCDHDYLTLKVGPDGIEPRDSAELMDLVSDIRQPVILCGHDHTPRTLHLTGGKLIVNPGSVGLQAFWDDQPFPHVMANGDPKARYSIVSHSPSGWNVLNICVAYNVEAAAATAEQHGRPDWAGWLRTGCA